MVTAACFGARRWILILIAWCLGFVGWLAWVACILYVADGCIALFCCLLTILVWVLHALVVLVGCLLLVCYGLVFSVMLGITGWFADC